jgi:hypothetical protein
MSGREVDGDPDEVHVEFQARLRQEEGDDGAECAGRAEWNERVRDRTLRTSAGDPADTSTLKT